MKPRLVIDPNIIASVLLGGLTNQRYDWLLSNLDRFDICYSETVLKEVMALPEVPFFKKKRITVHKVEEFVKDFQAYSIKILVSSNVRLGRDRNDFYLLGLARDGRA